MPCFINVFLLTKIVLRGGLALVNKHQLLLPVVMLRTISSWFRRQFVGLMFWYRETGGSRLASGKNRWLQFSNNRRRGRSLDHIIWISFFQVFLSFVYFSIYHFSWMCSFYNSFWKMYIKAINDLDPGLNLLESNKTADNNILVTYIPPFVKYYLKVLLP